MEEKKRELDLVDIFFQCYRGLKRIIMEILSWAGFFLKKTYKYKKMFVFFMLGAIAFSIYQTTGDRKTYEGEMILSLNDGNSALYSDIISSLDRFIQDKDFDGLADELTVSDTVAMAMRKLNTYFMVDMNKDSIYDFIDRKNEFIASDTQNVRMKDCITISITTNDLDIMPDIEYALLEYFQNNELLHNQNMARIEHLVSLEKSIDEEISKIDSLQELDYFKRDGATVKITKDFNVNTDRQMFYFNKLDLLKKKELVSRELFTKEKVVSVQKPLTATSTQSRRIIKSIIGYCANFYIVFLLFALYLNYRERIFKYLSKD